MSSTTPVGTTPREVIARDVLRAGVGGRLPTTVHYQESLGVGSGTVQKALKDLRNEGAMSLVARGHQGTYITELDAALLWSAARLSPVHLLLPPNAPPESMRVATAVAERFAAVGAYTTAGHLRGAEARLQAIEASRADIALMSAGAAGDLLSGGPAGHRTLTLGSGTYYAPGSLVVVTRTAGPGPGTDGAELRIGIDLDSDDHQRLTHAEFPEGAGRYVPTDFTSVPRAVLLGEIDAGIWHTVDSLIPLDAAGLAVSPLTRPEAVDLARAISAAVLVATQGNIPGVLLSRATDEGGELLAEGPGAPRPVLPGGDDPLRLRV
ncbi:YhfZ family protein [Streptomyces sp. NPDC102441]|uniref:YhfZ family protein n=1 Tax=Streptomyces sp. NPDC102441 TaxID=3366176 RepID=UPI003812D42B